MTITHQIPSAALLHTCLQHYCNFLVLDITTHAQSDDYNLVFVYYKYIAEKQVTRVIFNTKYKYTSPGRDALIHVLTSSPQFRCMYLVRNCGLKYEI